MSDHGYRPKARLARPLLILALPMVVLALLVTGCGDTSTQEDAPPGKLQVNAKSPPEAQLVSLDDKTPVVDTQKVRRYGHLFDLLGESCTDSRTQLSDYSVTARKLLDKKGIAISNFDVLRGVRGSIPSGTPKRSCRDLFAAFVTLRSKEP